MFVSVLSACLVYEYHYIVFFLSVTFNIKRYNVSFVHRGFKIRWMLFNLPFSVMVKVLLLVLVFI